MAVLAAALLGFLLSLSEVRPAGPGGYRQVPTPAPAPEMVPVVVLRPIDG
jgi:hypothetical protein